MLAASFLLQTVEAGSCPTLGLFSSVLPSLRSSLMVISSSRWFWPVQDSCGCCRMDIAGYICFLKVLLDVGWFWPVSDGSCRSQPDLRIVFLSSCLILMQLMVFASSSCLWLVKDCCGRVYMAIVGSLRYLMVLACSRQ